MEHLKSPEQIDLDREPGEPPPDAASRGLRKVLVLDCDDTLWGGVVGEEGLDGLELGSSSSRGALYTEVQHLILALQRQGVILALNSKNDAVDVAEVFAKHPEMILAEEHLATKRVNWHDKAENLRSMAQELGLGLDSFVFLDDSDFEVGGMRARLPQVVTLQVPKTLADYPDLVRRARSLFFPLVDSPEGGQGAPRGGAELRQQQEREA